MIIQRALLVLLLTGADSRAADLDLGGLEERRLAKDKEFRALQGKRLDPKFYHFFAPIDPGWRVEKNERGPSGPDPDSNRSAVLYFYCGELPIKGLHVKQDGKLISETDYFLGAQHTRQWREDGSLYRFSTSRNQKMVSGFSHCLRDDTVSAFQDGRGVWNDYAADGALRATYHIHDGETYYSERIFKGVLGRTFGSWNDLSLHVYPGNEQLRLRGRTWRREGDVVIGGSKIHYTPVPPIGIGLYNSKSYSDRRAKRRRAECAEARAEVIAGLRTRLEKIGQQELLDRVLHGDEP